MKGLIQVSGKKLTNTLRRKIFVACNSLSSSCKVVQSSRRLLHISAEELPDTIALKNAIQSNTNLEISISASPFQNIIFVTIL